MPVQKERSPKGSNAFRAFSLPVLGRTEIGAVPGFISVNKSLGDLGEIFFAFNRR